MAANFRNSKTQNITANAGEFTTIYTNPGGAVTSICIGLALSYKGNLGTVALSNCVLVNSANTVSTSVITNGQIPGGATLVLSGVDQKIVIQPGEFLRANCNLAGQVDVIVNVLELS